MAQLAVEREFWDARYWQAVLNREADMDGAVYYAVISTGVYCRPSCGSRKPRRDNVLFFVRREDAERAGFRPCQRCTPDRASGNPRIDMVRAVCRYFEAHLDEPAPLAKLGRELGFSPFHIQRTFKAVLGVSPRVWLEERRLQHFKQGVRGGAPVTRALYDAGYGSSSRLYEHAGARLGMTPAAYRKGGAGMNVAFTVADSGRELGKVLIAATARGICAVRFGDSERELEAGIRAEFPSATIARDDDALAGHARAVEGLLAGAAPASDLPLDIRATAFCRRVWDVLRAIPRGETRTYAEVAAAAGSPRATRAVGRACGANPVAIVIPCHRVIRSDGQLGGYRWGLDRKRVLLERESRRS